MKKKYLYLIVIVSMVMLTKGNAQNLVQNGSFEDTIQCPVVDGFVTQCKYWSAPTVAPSGYYNSCAEQCICLANFGVPWNDYGWQNARTGNAYMMIATRSLNGSERYYIESKLLDTLVAGQKYIVQFYTSLSDSSERGCNDVGIYFSVDSVFDSIQTNLPFIAQIENSSTHYLGDKIGWTLVSDTLTAIGNEIWIIIGNFKPDSLSTIYNVSGGSPFFPSAELYIDDVSIVPLINVGVNDNDLRKKILVYPNPTLNSINVYVGDFFQSPYTITIYNGQSKMIWGIDNFKEENLNIDLSNFAQGIYALNIKSNKYNITKKIVKF